MCVCSKVCVFVWVFWPLPLSSPLPFAPSQHMAGFAVAVAVVFRRGHHRKMLNTPWNVGKMSLFLQREE